MEFLLSFLRRHSLGEGTSGGVAKCRLFSRARRNIIVLGAIACVASVSVCFQTKERRRNGIFGFGRARNETRAKKSGEGGGGGEEGRSLLPHPLPALLLAPFFALSLTLVPRSLLRNQKETIATRALGATKWDSISNEFWVPSYS